MSTASCSGAVFLLRSDGRQRSGEPGARGLDWSRHIRSAYFANADLSHWTLDNPYLDPLRQITFNLPEPRDEQRPSARAWFEDGTPRQTMRWVDLESSLQWRAFQRLIGNLQERANELFILVGPLNEHMLEQSNVAVYKAILSRVEEWLVSQDLAYYAPAALPSEFYADMSHPLARGYALLAGELWGRMAN